MRVARKLQPLPRTAPARGAPRADSRLLLTLCSLLMLPGTASAVSISLDTLQGQTTSVGSLSFDWTKVESTGDVDLSMILLSMESDTEGEGFDLTPAISSAMRADHPEKFDIKLEFRVTSTIPILQVGNHLQGAVQGQYSVSVFETLAEDLANPTAFIAYFGSQPDAVELLASPQSELNIVKNIVVDFNAAGVQTGDYGRIDLLRQRFTVVPEPGTGLLVLLGLGGIGIVGRRADRC
jgi:hypothetical protein